MINVSEQRLQTTCLLFIVAVLSSFAAYWLRPVLVPFVVAVFIVSGVSPILEALQRSVASTRLMAAAIAFLVGCLLIALLMGALWASVVDLAKNAGAYQRRVEELITEAQDYIPWETSESADEPSRRKRLLSPRSSIPANSKDETETDGDSASEKITVANADSKNSSDDSPVEKPSPEEILIKETSPSEVASSPSEEPTGEPADKLEIPVHLDVTVSEKDGGNSSGNQLESDSLDRAVSNEFDAIKARNPIEGFEDFVTRTLKSGVFHLSQVFLEMISTSLIVLIYVFFLLLGAPASQTSSPVWRDLDRQIRTYLSLKTIISLVTGFAFGFALWIFGIPMAVAFGMLAFLLNFIPNIGPIIASLLPLPLILLAPDGTLLWMGMAITVTFGVQFLSGNVIEPKIMGQQSDLHPIVILLALMFWGMLWGIVGMFLATPITAAIRLALLQFELTRPVAEVMAGRLPGKEETTPSTA
ncbi:AI-2E family transporter [Thalassoglobus polymorphus]|uniref:AI-2 transport protein TqsA n=1 Tax=Thalassoglobus polymorphus TaxID=2527994 RepID=A0A517QJA5_9PLAN|nr:AI-2E family transporter [Thalassoglobus polymorphus]QDT31706.1 AI-2 transport protein TqsA [Thalassoglobus polymorphus]